MRTVPLAPGPAPAPDGLRRAFGDARRRRLRTLGAASVTPVLAGVLVLAVAPSGRGSFTLTPVEPAGPGGRHERIGAPAGAPRPALSVTSATPSPMPTAEPSATGSPTPEPHPTHSRPTAAPDRRRDDPSLPDDPTAPAHDVERATDYGRGPMSCEAPGDWCVRLGYDTDQTHPAIEIQLCRDAPIAGKLTFPTGQEVDFAVADRSGTELWRWSRLRAADGGAHTVDVPRFGCIRWWTRWDRVDDAGARLPAGRYVLRASVLADETPAVRDVEREFAL